MENQKFEITDNQERYIQRLSNQHDLDPEKVVEEALKLYDSLSSKLKVVESEKIMGEIQTIENDRDHYYNQTFKATGGNWMDES